MNATKKANAAAKAEFDSHLVATRATATASVPQCVIDAANAAYAAAGGGGRVVVVGRGNATHPVCGVEVRPARRGEVA